jgi:hypothetical protein
MPKIAPQHAWKDPDHVPSDQWSDATYVQWGSRGFVVGKNPYTTAFFEAFPPQSEDAGGFIRGEGETIALAEEDALRKYLRGQTCDHLWGREKYRNGGQLCRHCRAFRSGVLPSIMVLGDWRQPISRSEVMILDIQDDEDEDNPKSKTNVETPYIRKLRIRRRIFGEMPKPQYD